MKDDFCLPLARRFITTDRPHFGLTIIELRKMFLAHGHEIAVLEQLQTELKLRDSTGARQLLRRLWLGSRAWFESLWS